MKLIRRVPRFRRFIKDIVIHTPVIGLTLLLIILWLLFSFGIFIAEQQVQDSPISTIGQALYWGVAAFSTAGIASQPVSSIALFLGGSWIILGSLLFFGAIVATINSYFNRPLQRPDKRIIDTIEYNLEQLDDLTLEELDLLKDTVDTLIIHVEKLKQKQASH